MTMSFYILQNIPNENYILPYITIRYQCLSAIILIYTYSNISQYYNNRSGGAVVEGNENDVRNYRHEPGLVQGISNFSFLPKMTTSSIYIYISRLKTSSMANKVSVVGSFSVLPSKRSRDSGTEIPSSSLPKRVYLLPFPLSATTPSPISLHRYISSPLPISFVEHLTQHTHNLYI